MQTAVSNSLVDDVVYRVIPLYGSRLVGIYLCAEPLYDAEEGADVDFLVVLRGEVNVYHEISVLSGPASDVSLDNSLVVLLYPLSEADFASPRSAYIASAKVTARRVA